MNPTAVEMGESLFAQGRYEEARDCFLSAVEAFPDDPQALNDLGVVSLTLGRNEAAEEYFLKALEVSGDYLEARTNLIDYYLAGEQWDQAAVQLEKALESSPADERLRAALAAAYRNLGRTEEAIKVAGESPTASLAREFIDSIWFAINHWELAEDLGTRERLEGLAAAVLAIIDGDRGPKKPMKLITADENGSGPLVLEDLADKFYYKQQESIELSRLREQAEDDSSPTLEVDRDEFNELRRQLLYEIGNEGGCLGDFTHTRKIMKRDPELRKFSLDRSLEYFRQNLGPCDCHVYKGRLV